MRTVCLRCFRPETTCYCNRLPRIESRTRVIFLQHPRERRVAIGTARMAHLALPNSELHHGVDFTGHPRVESLARMPERTAVLFPGAQAKAPADFADAPLENLIVVDGTWSQARKVVMRNPLLAGLPRIAFQPRRPSNYRIRAEPAEHCVSTIEAVVETLGALEGDQERFDSMLRTFEHMVDTQIAHERSGLSPPRRRLRKPVPKLHPGLRQLKEAFPNFVLLYAEANAHPMDAGIAPELLHLVAIRPGTNRRFEALLAARKPMGSSTSLHLEIAPSELAKGESLPEALARFSAFLEGVQLIGVWSTFALELIKQEMPLPVPALDLRRLRAQLLKSRVGGVEHAAEALSGLNSELTPWAQGRAGRRLAALERVVASLLLRAG